MGLRWDETWHRLNEWTNGQAPSERLAAQILLSEGYTSLDPSHPLGGPDGMKDALCQKDGAKWVMAVFFPRGQNSLREIERKLLADLVGVAANHAHALAFVTNQELSLAARDALRKASGSVPVEIYHLDRVTTILDQPRMRAVRKQFLNIDFDPSVDEALDVLVAPERDEREIRQAIVGVNAVREELLNRGTDAGGFRCNACGSPNVKHTSGSYLDQTIDVWTCLECGEHLGDCVG